MLGASIYSVYPEKAMFLIGMMVGAALNSVLILWYSLVYDLNKEGGKK